MSKLIIVESPTKVKSIKKYLGGGYEVMASMGHVRDLPKSKLGVDTEHDFKPQYINMSDKKDLIKQLKTAARLLPSAFRGIYYLRRQAGLSRGGDIPFLSPLLRPISYCAAFQGLSA